MSEHIKESLIKLRVTHKAEISHLAEMIAGRAYTMSGVENVEIITETDELREAGFTPGEIALGTFEVYRG